MANYTLRVIMDNFEAMLVEMPFNKVTVSALVERCEISSNTFYYHFRDIYDLLDRWISMKANEYIKLDDVDQDWTECMKVTLKAMQMNSKLVYHIWDIISKERLENYIFDDVQKWFYEVVKKRLSDAEVSDNLLQDIVEFYCYSIFGFVCKFLWDHMKADVDYAVDRLSSEFRGITEYIVSREANTFV